MLDSDEGQFPNSIHFDLKLGQSPKPSLESSQWTRLPPYGVAEGMLWIIAW